MKRYVFGVETVDVNECVYQVVIVAKNLKDARRQIKKGEGLWSLEFEAQEYQNIKRISRQDEEELKEM